MQKQRSYIVIVQDSKSRAIRTIDLTPGKGLTNIRRPESPLDALFTKEVTKPKSG